jgi:hypothetical protein
MTSWIDIHCNECNSACDNGDEIYCEDCYSALAGRVAELEAQISKLEEAANE